MISPLKKPYRISSAYGMRTINKVTSMHYGCDLVCLDGTQGAELVSTVDGTVTDMRNSIPDSHTGLGITTHVVGNYIYITTPDGYQVMYKHLRFNSIPAKIQKGSKVKIGDIVGRMGRTGQSTPTADHLHYEFRDPKGLAFDPLPYLNTVKMFPKAVVQAPTPALPQSIKEKDKVKVLSAVNYDTGGPFMLYYPQYDVIQVKGARVVIGIGSVITGAVDVKNLQKVG